MSLDLWMDMDTGGEEPVRLEQTDDNYTHNVNEMWEELFGDALGYFLAGKTGAETRDVLAAGVERMKADPDLFKAMNPGNGWGDYEGALEFLEHAAKSARENPRATWAHWS